jgi:hypothetical protein
MGENYKGFGLNKKYVGEVKDGNVTTGFGLGKKRKGYIEDGTVYRGYGLNREIAGSIEGDTIYRGYGLDREIIVIQQCAVVNDFCRRIAAAQFSIAVRRTAVDKILIIILYQGNPQLIARRIIILLAGIAIQGGEIHSHGPIGLKGQRHNLEIVRSRLFLVCRIGIQIIAGRIHCIAVCVKVASDVAVVIVAWNVD